MPSSVNSVMAAAGLSPEGVVRWGEPIETPESGIYVVSTVGDVELVGHNPRQVLIDPHKIDFLLTARPELTVDGVRPSAAELSDRVSEFWLQDEHVLYIGSATNLRKRVGQYYQTQLGARRPHAGGWFLKTLTHLDKVSVHWSCTDDRLTAEAAALGAFVAAVSQDSRRYLRDPDRPFPFANLEWPAGTRKRHGIKGAKAPRLPRSS